MNTPNPTTLTQSTRLAPATVRSRSQSPTRSPQRKAQFTARELDPLLANLSPDSTLKALQTTETIRSEGLGQDVLARSIAEATPSEREIGIRAAVAAQKVKQWHREVSLWPWPNRRDRGWGAGFLPPPQPTGRPSTIDNEAYLGFLPISSVDTCQHRIEDIRDGLEALDLEEVKDHVFSAHIPQRSVSAPYALETEPGVNSTGYGRMRDFTALITATVIQALPELANLNTLLDTWDVRLSVLRQIPEITQIFKTTRSGIQTAFSVVRSLETGPLVTVEECEATKSILGGKVALLGSKIDKLLDMLEGHEDSLPKSWIDTLEIVENEYAAWVVEAEHIAIRNGLLAKALAKHRGHDSKPSTRIDTVVDEQNPTVTQPQIPGQATAVEVPVLRTNDGLSETAEEQSVGTPIAELPPNDFFRRPSLVRKSLSNHGAAEHAPLTTSISKQGHNRGVSEVSMANSTFSAMSDLSTAEIVDAKSTQVLMSPKINVVNNPLRASRDELSWSTTPPLDLDHGTNFRPPMIQRASTASIEMVSRKSIKQVTLTRSRSHDMLRSAPPPVPHTTHPSNALQQPNNSTARSKPLLEEHEGEADAVLLTDRNAIVDTPSSGLSPTPSLIVKPLRVRSRGTSGVHSESPALPRRSSKRKSQTFEPDTERYEPTASIRTLDESHALPTEKALPERSDTDDVASTLEARIQGVLSTMSNQIGLAHENELDVSQRPRFTAAARSSTPQPALILCPIKSDRVLKQNDSKDIRVYHLANAGHTQEAPLAKLFVRSVGDRVMVRVGGGWVDLAEYLREYSLHHGHRGLASDNLEVVDFPASRAKSNTPSALPVPAAMLGDNTVRISEATLSASPKRMSLPNMLDASTLAPLNIPKSRKTARDPGLDTSNSNSTTSSGISWRPPPVPPIPVTYTKHGLTTATTTVNGVTNTSITSRLDSGSSGGQRAVSAPVSMSKTPEGRSRSTGLTTPGQPIMNGSYSYIPPGAARPNVNERRAVTPNRPSNSQRESWVDGMVGRARALSNGNTIIHGPTTTTTTTIVSRTMPINTSRRMSAFANLNPAKTPTPTPMPSAVVRASSPASVEPKVEATPARSKNRMSFGDVSGIRRVFFRKKSDRS